MSLEIDFKAGVAIVARSQIFNGYFGILLGVMIGELLGMLPDGLPDGFTGELLEVAGKNKFKPISIRLPGPMPKKWRTNTNAAMISAPFTVNLSSLMSRVNTNQVAATAATINTQLILSP
jgi:hypothetical protein